MKLRCEAFTAARVNEDLTKKIKVQLPVGAELHHCVQTDSGATQPTVQWVPRALFLWIN
jgi:hypothetical protein